MAKIIFCPCVPHKVLIYLTKIQTSLFDVLNVIRLALHLLHFQQFGGITNLNFSNLKLWPQFCSSYSSVRFLD